MSNDDLPSYDEFAHRQQHPLKDVTVHRQEVERIVQELLKLEARTHPQNTNPGEKELDSISALIWAGKLVEKLAGWAMDHRAGMVLNGATVYRWPEDDEEAPAQANDHRHEAMGSAYLQEGHPGIPIQTRRIVAEVTARAAVLPPALRNEVAEAIAAVDFGETRPIFEPPKGQRKKAYTGWQLRLRAIEHVYFLWGTGSNKAPAVGQVANAFGVSAATVDSWDRRDFALKNHIGGAALKVAQDTAKHCGEKFSRLQMQLHKSDADNTYIKYLSMTYGPEALSLNAQRYNAINRADLE